MKLLNELEIRAMFLEIEGNEFSSDEILELWGIDEKNPLRELYVYFLKRSNEEFGEYQKAKKNLRQKSNYNSGTILEIKLHKSVKDNLKRIVDNYPQTREEIIEGMVEENIKKIRYAGNNGLVNKISDSLKER